jgi:hypothetical protein
LSSRHVSGKPENRKTGKPENRKTGKPENRKTGKPENRNAAAWPFRGKGRISAALGHMLPARIRPASH